MDHEKIVEAIQALGQKSCLEKAALWAQIIGIVAIVATLIIYACQLAAMRKQIVVAEKASQSGILFQLFQMLDGVRTQRATVFELAKKTDSELDELWKKKDSEIETEYVAAERVAGSFNVAALLAFNGIVPRNIIIQEWGTPATKAYKVLRYFLRRERQSRGPNLWVNFDELVKASNGGTLPDS